VLVKLPYGTSELEFDLNTDRVLGLIRPAEITPAADPTAVVEQALATPVGGPTIDRLASREKTVAIAVDDVTRTTPTHLLLTPLLRALRAAGVRKNQVTIFVALGTHRPMTTSEMKEKYGPAVVEEYTFMNHAFDDPSQLTYMADVAGDVPVWINKAFITSDLRIVTGNIIPHFNAGWAAGAKILLPGLAGEETVGRMHVHSALTTPNGLGLEDNPTRQMIDAFGEQVKIHLLINSVITRHKEIVSVYAGHFLTAHRRGIAHAKQVYSVPLPGLADITVSSSYPCDLDYWQGLKGLFSADLATKVGGGIVAVTPCPEGVSAMHPLWLEYLQYGTAELKAMYQAGTIQDYVALGLALNVAYIREKHPVCLVSDGISDQAAEKMRFQKFDSVDDALHALTRRYGADSTINVLTHGGETYPRPAG
jgi:nickel-dependent lactate racemase